MKKLVVNFRDGGYLNVEADKIEVNSGDENVILAYSNGNLVAAIDMSSALSLYLTEMKTSKEVSQDEIQVRPVAKHQSNS